MKNNLNIFEELSDTEIKQLNKLDIKIENKEYTREYKKLIKVFEKIENKFQ